jgi:hypothetical protein
MDEDSNVARRVRRRTLGRAIREDPGAGSAWCIRDVSISGAFLETNAPIPIGSELELALVFGTAVIHVTARVIRIQQPDWGQVGGVGVEFTRFRGDSQQFLESYIAATEAETY